MRRSAAILLAASAVVCVGSGANALAQGATPVTKIVPLHTSLAVALRDVQIGIFAPDGRLWVAVPPGEDGGVATLMEIALPSGRVMLTRALDSGVAGLIVGPDGNVWFAGGASGGTVSVGRVSPSGGLKSFVVHRCCGVDGLAAGPDGEIWLTVGGVDPTLVRVSMSGKQTSWDESSAFLGWNAGLVDGAEGTLWTSVSHFPRDNSVAGLAQIDMNGRVRTDRTKLNPAALDATGHLRGWDGNGRMLGLDAGDRLSEFPLSDPSTTLLSSQEATVLGADQRVWFTADNELSYSPAEYDDQVIGAASRTSPGTIQTWPSPFIASDGAAVGNIAPADNGLIAGPDGRLYALGYQKNDPSNVPLWHLFAVTLPNHPKMRPGTVHLNRIAHRGRTVSVRLSCTGSSGRDCAGTITVRSITSTVFSASYALGPGLQATHSIKLPPNADPRTVIVTSNDAIARSTETRRATISG